MTDEIMPITEFKAGIRRLAESETAHPLPRFAALRLALGYAKADDDAKRDCSRMLREDLAALDAGIDASAAPQPKEGESDES